MSDFQRSFLIPVVLAGSLLAALPAAAKSVAGRVAKPRIEAAFVLDTTGSMSGLIEGAKRKIWSLANRMTDAQDGVDLRIALVGYRDRGDAYVTKLHDLDGDIDSVHANLLAFHADGGGDGPESVNQALHEAVTRLSWSTGAHVYRVVFLVGDAPPHLDYVQDVHFEKTVAEAARRNIVINTIQCGDWTETRSVWRRIAALGEGEYAAIAADGGMLAVVTPMDGELTRLQAELAATVIPYGSTSERDELREKVSVSEKVDSSVVASRLSYLSKKGGSVVSGRSDLVDAVAAGDVEPEELSAEALPEPMRAMSPAQRRAHVTKQVERRRELNEQVTEVVKKREAYLDARRAEPEQEDAFDTKVFRAVKSQAAAAGILYAD